MRCQSKRGRKTKTKRALRGRRKLKFTSDSEKFSYLLGFCKAYYIFCITIGYEIKDDTLANLILRLRDSFCPSLSTEDEERICVGLQPIIDEITNLMIHDLKMRKN